MFAVFRLLPPQGGESVAPYQAFGAHPLMQITETLHIMHCSKSLYTNITPFFPTLQADPSDSANDTKTAPASCYRNRSGSIALLVLFQALTQNLAGVLDSSLSGCQNYRAFGNHSSPSGYCSTLPFALSSFGLRCLITSSIFITRMANIQSSPKS